MSAYDNPTIIKNDSALMWAEAMNKFGENFNKSFEASQNRQYLEDKELRENAEKRKKESEQLIINGQQASAKIQNENQADYNKVVSDEPKNIDAGLLETLNKDVLSINEKIGQIKAKQMTTVLTDEDKKILGSESVYLATRQNILKTTAATSLSMSEYEKIAGGDGTGASINGTTALERTTNWYTMMALNPANIGFKDKATKSFEWDKSDLSKATLAVSTKFADEKELHDAITKLNPGITSDELVKITAESNKDITKNKDGSYSINFKRSVGDGSWNGEFYSKVPPIFKGDELKNAGVVDEKGNLSDDLLGTTTKIQSKDYKGTVAGAKGFWTGTVVKEEDAKAKLYPVVEARIKSLLAVDFKDLNVLQGFLTNRLKQGTKYMADKINEMPDNEKVTLLTKLSIEQELGESFKTSTTLVKDPNTGAITRYLGNTKDIDEVKPENPSSAGGSTGTQKNQADLNAEALYIIKNGGTFRGKGGLILNIDTNGKANVTKIDGSSLSEQEVSLFKNKSPKEMANMIGARLR